MSEIDLIKKLERLRNVRPNKEWVNFTRESILSSNPIIQKQGFWESFNLVSLAPMMACVFTALVLGSFITSNNNEEEVAKEENIKVEDFQAAVVDKKEIPISIPEQKKENREIASTNDLEKDIMEKMNLSVILNEVDKEALTKEIENRVERIRNEVKECKKIEQSLLIQDEKAKERCDNFEEQLNYLEQVLNSEEN